MTRKDYVLLAEALNAARCNTDGGYSSVTEEQRRQRMHGVAIAARAVCHALARENARFDSERFLAACGTQPGE
jgi:hypothetical protein